MANGGGDLWAQSLYQLRPGQALRGPYGRAVALAQDASRYAAVTPDGRQLLLGSGWQGGAATVLTGHTDLVLALAAHPATDRLATGGRDHTVRVWSVSTNRSVDLRGHRNAVTGVAWRADGSRLASCSLDGTVKVWDPAGGLEILTIKGLDGEVRAVAFSPDGNRLAVAHGGKVTVWTGDDPNTLRNP
jgi:WD40 repeat protein